MGSLDMRVTVGCQPPTLRGPRRLDRGGQAGGGTGGVVSGITAVSLCETLVAGVGQAVLTNVGCYG